MGIFALCAPLCFTFSVPFVVNFLPQSSLSYFAELHLSFYILRQEHMGNYGYYQRT